MNYLAPPVFDDVACLGALANNAALSSYPHLQPMVAAIGAAYAAYNGAQGQAAVIANVAVPAAVVDYLHTHFKSPPVALSFIKKLRTESGPKTCPLCGSLGCGTLDHLIPRTAYPEFSVYSRNLVPACKCNSSKNDLLHGQAPGERVLHPYFDQCLATRLVRARFRDHGKAPLVELEVLMDGADPMRIAVDFHVNSIVAKTSVVGHLRNQWVKLCRKPSLVVPKLDVQIQGRDQLAQILQNELLRLDELHESLNNWNSLMLAGLLEATTLDWLFARLSTPGYAVDAPLEWV